MTTHERVVQICILYFPPGVLPEAGVQTVKFHLDADDPSGGYFTYKTYNVTTTEPMPSVAALKEVDGETKITIGVMEKKIGLKITWNDPDFKDIMKPGIQLRVYIGGNNGDYETGNLTDHEIYYWIDCPAQMHKLLVTSDAWESLKAQLIGHGFTEAKILIVYRTIEGGDDAADEGQFMNRGHSDLITIPLLQ